LLIWAGLVFLKSVEVSRSNQFLLSTLNPELMSYALREIFRNQWGVLARVGLTLGVGLSLLWIVTASLARAATTRVLLEHAASEYGEERETRSNVRAVAAIQVLRVGLLWCGFAAYVLAAIVADKLTRNNNQAHIAAFLLLFLTMILVAAVVLSFLNWILLLAPIYAVRDHVGFFEATLAAWRLSRDRASSLAGLNLAHAGIRLVWFVVMTGLAFAPLGFLRIAPRLLIYGSIVLVSLAYFIVADMLFVARYGGYIDIAERELHPELPIATAPPISAPVYAAVEPPGSTISQPVQELGPEVGPPEPSA
jgi:hypothetical protein